MKSTAIFLWLACFNVESLFAEGIFFREHWAQWDHRVTNLREGERLRVNDPQLSLHPNYGKRREARANGLQLISIPEDLFSLERAELYLELWGGHPKTANKRFFVNGRGPYSIPDDRAQAGHCAYSYPVIPLQVNHLVTGTNAFQFACDRGETFWGHYIVDELAVRCVLEPNHPDLLASGLHEFTAQVKVSGHSPVLADRTGLSLACPQRFLAAIQSVEYFGHYLGYDDNGDGLQTDWHGYTHDRVYQGHIGKAVTAPFAVDWNTRMMPSQIRPMRVKALVHFKEGFHYWTPPLTGLTFPSDRPRVALHGCDALPIPFWSRAERLKQTTITLPGDLSRLDIVQLWVRIWDGGEGTRLADHFQINGHPYKITSGRSNHDLVFTRQPIDPAHLKPGKNEISLISDTDHHGIEVCLPGPCLILREKAG